MTVRMMTALAGGVMIVVAAAGAVAQAPRGKVSTLTKATAPEAPAAHAVSGEAIFAANCAACHQPRGEGIAGAFPALAGNVFVKGDPDLVAQTLLNGRGGMPSFRDELDDASIAAVISYVRTSWGNTATPITADLVAKNRAGKEIVTERPIPAH